MGNVTSKDCEERRETLFTLAHSKLASKVFWTVFLPAIALILGLLAIVYQKSNGNTDRNRENEVALARIETGVQWIQKEMKK